ncbi:amino acid synthesis family protein [Sediminicoccus sp. KRV36]|uniref:amino acid synthesis family protein n=1 Tax=Sediminicoccus sp. KRV36 TaxID=3133721 RepID=UPI00200D5D3E|nr:amino acid synthesis family protein [Sediminicoccus rosea]UPY36752.1 amino acid synthesis family protein [Sediminicoccus rosea]
MIIRKIFTSVEETRLEMGREVSPPIRRAIAAMVLKNPFAGRYVEDLSELIEASVPLGAELAARAIAALGIPGDQVHSFGKAAIVGEDGELEHAAALLHPKMGAPVRAALGKGPALIPSAKKRGGPGTPIDIPLGHKDAAFVRSHFDAIEARLTDAPMRDEILLCLALTTGGRPLPRVGGLTTGEIIGQDGLR